MIRWRRAFASNSTLPQESEQFKVRACHDAKSMEKAKMPYHKALVVEQITCQEEEEEEEEGQQPGHGGH